MRVQEGPWSRCRRAAVHSSQGVSAGVLQGTLSATWRAAPVTPLPGKESHASPSHDLPKRRPRLRRIQAPAGTRHARRPARAASLAWAALLAPLGRDLSGRPTPAPTRERFSAPSALVRARETSPVSAANESDPDRVTRCKRPRRPKDRVCPQVYRGLTHIGVTRRRRLRRGPRRFDARGRPRPHQCLGQPPGGSSSGDRPTAVR